MNRKEDLINYIKAKIDEKFAEVEVTPYQQQRLKCMVEIIELIEKYKEKPLTLADLLGWEEGVEYDYKDLYVLKVENNRLFMKSEKCSSGWCNFVLFSDEIEDLQQAKKIEPKLKAYHVKDEYSYNELMKELEEQGYIWAYNQNPSDCDYWGILKEETVVYCSKNKYLSYSRLDYYTEYVKDKYDLIEYKKEEPKFYAKIKGWELLEIGERYWNYDTEIDCFLPSNKGYCDGYTTMATKTEWNELGINDTNADWEEVAE